MDHTDLAIRDESPDRTSARLAECSYGIARECCPCRAPAQEPSQYLDMPPNVWGTLGPKQSPPIDVLSQRDFEPPRPGSETSDSAQLAKSILTSNRASATDKLKAVEQLHEAGVREIQLPDADSGSLRTYAIEKVPIGKRHMVHLFSNDDAGNRRIVLRGIANGDGSYQQQRSQNGSHVGFYGDWWSANMKGRSGLSLEGQKSNQDAEELPDEGGSGQRTRRPRRSIVSSWEEKSLQPPDRDAGLPAREPYDNPPGMRRREAPYYNPPVDDRKALPPQRDTSRPGYQDEDFSPRPRPILERSRFYTHQRDGKSCGPTSLAMLKAHLRTGEPPSAAELKRLSDLTGTSRAGRFPGTVDDMARYVRTLNGMNSRAYNYREGDPRAIEYLDNELAQGHGILLRVRNPRTTNNHWIYVAGKNDRGEYIIGDPDRGNSGGRLNHDKPISRQHLISMMRHRNGFVAGW
ncbi:MAG TPA: papain-like cysteine protease family protein [Candidatus Obscuribacterales bacterium]